MLNLKCTPKNNLALKWMIQEYKSQYSFYLIYCENNKSPIKYLQFMAILGRGLDKCFGVNTEWHTDKVLFYRDSREYIMNGEF